MSELFIVEFNDGFQWVPTTWTGAVGVVRAKPVDLNVAERTLTDVQRKYPNAKYRIVPAPPEGA